jgi:hypothetical protein
LPKLVNSVLRVFPARGLVVAMCEDR